MDSGLLLTLLAAAGAVLVVAVVAMAVVLSRTVRGQREVARELADSRRELADLRHDLEADRDRGSDAVADVLPALVERGYLITTAGDPEPADPVGPGRVVDARAFAGVAVGESAVLAVSFVHGLRRALSPSSRNRIGFEMRRQVRTSRKQRRRDLKEARRTLRAQRATADERAA